jgi:hypothetical protein
MFMNMNISMAMEVNMDMDKDTLTDIDTEFFTYIERFGYCILVKAPPSSVQLKSGTALISVITDIRLSSHPHLVALYIHTSRHIK